jgi:hypothetical protein
MEGIHRLCQPCTGMMCLDSFMSSWRSLIHA